MIPVLEITKRFKQDKNGYCSFATHLKPPKLPFDHPFFNNRFICTNLCLGFSMGGDK